MANSLVNFSAQVQIQDATVGSAVLLNRVFPALQFASSGQAVYSGFISLGPTGGFGQNLFTGVNASVLLVRNAGNTGFVDVQVTPVITAAATFTLAPGGMFIFFNPISTGDADVFLTSANLLNDTNSGILVEYLYAI